MKIMKRKWKDNAAHFLNATNNIILSALALVRQRRFICRTNTQTNETELVLSKQKNSTDRFFKIENIAIVFKSFST
jgi:cytidylate kinase